MSESPSAGGLEKGSIARAQEGNNSKGNIKTIQYTMLPYLIQQTILKSIFNRQTCENTIEEQTTHMSKYFVFFNRTAAPNPAQVTKSAKYG